MWIKDKFVDSLDPTGGSEITGAYHDLSTGFDGWLRGAWDTFSGKNNYRAPEKVFDPWSEYNRADSLQDRTAQQQTFNQMNEPNAYYKGLMVGTSPSLAENQMKQGIAQAQQQAMQSAAAARGMDRAAAFRNAQNNAANLTAQGAIAGGQQRLQEQQLGAQGYSQGTQAMNNMASTVRQQDIGEQQGLMGLQNQAQQNLNQQYQINAGVGEGNAARQQKAVGGLMQMGGAALAALSDIRAKEDIAPVTGYAGPNTEAMARAYASRAPGITASKPGEYNALSQGLSAFGGGSGVGAGGDNGQMFDPSFYQNIASATQQAAGTGGGGGMDLSSLPVVGGMLSDEKSKEAFKGIHPYQFEYKDQVADKMGKQAAQNAYMAAFTDAKTPRMGVMAQDLAKNPETRSAVVPTNEGLAIDGKRALALLLASAGDFNDRLARLEGRRG